MSAGQETEVQVLPLVTEKYLKQQAAHMVLTKPSTSTLVHRKESPCSL